MTYHSTDLDSLFQALADPTRRSVLAQLSKGPASVTELAHSFDMALPSFMGHLKKLEDGGLIDTSKQGRVRTCTLHPGALAPARDWIEEQRDLWQGRFDRLEGYLSSLTKAQNHGS